MYTSWLLITLCTQLHNPSCSLRLHVHYFNGKASSTRAHFPQFDLIPKRFEH